MFNLREIDLCNLKLQLRATMRLVDVANQVCDITKLYLMSATQDIAHQANIGTLPDVMDWDYIVTDIQEYFDLHDHCRSQLKSVAENVKLVYGYCLGVGAISIKAEGAPGKILDVLEKSLYSGKHILNFLSSGERDILLGCKYVLVEPQLFIDTLYTIGAHILSEVPSEKLN